MTEWSVQIGGLAAAEEALRSYSSRLKNISGNVSGIEAGLRQNCPSLPGRTVLRGCALSISQYSVSVSALAAGLREISRHYSDTEQYVCGIFVAADDAESFGPISGSFNPHILDRLLDALLSIADYRQLLSKLSPVTSVFALWSYLIDPNGDMSGALESFFSGMEGSFRILEKGSDAKWWDFLGFNILSKNELAEKTIGGQLDSLFTGTAASDWMDRSSKIVTVISEFFENYEEWQSGAIDLERFLDETLVESAVNIGVDIAATALAAKLVAAGALAIGAAPTAIVVGVTAVGIAWAGNVVVEAIFDKPLDELVSDLYCDTKEAVENAFASLGDIVGEGVQQVREGISSAWDAICFW